MSWHPICSATDIPVNAGMAALIGARQIAVFHIDEQFFAVDNFCPLSKTNSLSRGILGTLNGELCVASPLYKQHYALRSGQCLEDDGVAVNTYPVRIENGVVEVELDAASAAA